jgi:hypothetical protein
MNVQFRLLDKADKEISKLPRSVKGASYDFQRKFREDPDQGPLAAVRRRHPRTRFTGDLLAWPSKPFPADTTGGALKR